MTGWMRIWDKDFNLLYSGRTDDQLYVTVDNEDERRFSGQMKLEFP